MTEAETTSQSTALTIRERAAIALGSSEREKALIALATQAKEITAITNTAGYQQCHATRMSLKRARLEIENLGEAARVDAREFQKGVIAEERRLIALVSPEEDRLQTIQGAHDAKVEAEKQAKAKAEKDRLDRIQAGIDEIKHFAIDVIGKSAAEIAIAMDQLEPYKIDEWAGEFKDVAEQAKVDTMNRLNTMHAAAVEREAAARAEAERLAAEDARLKAESAELERRKAEQAEREREEKALMEEAMKRRMEEDRLAREKIEADQKAARDRIEAQEREARAQREEADRQAKSAREAEEAKLRAVREAEEKRIVAEREKLEKERLAKEKRDKEAADKLEAKARAKREKEEAAERARLLKEQERMDARQMLEAFVTRYGALPEFAGVVGAIEACLAKEAA